MRIRRIYLEGRGAGRKLHSLYNELINYPPDGYEFVTDHPPQVLKKLSFIHSFEDKIRNCSITGNLWSIFRPLAYFAYCKTKRRAKKGTDLTYSSQHLIFRREPWVVDLEHVGALAAYGYLAPYKSVIEKALASNYCKKIIPWSEVGKKSLLLNLDCEKFREKIEVVRLAVHPKQFTKQYNEDKVKLLFVGTGNIFNVATSFDLRGGKEVLKAFEWLNKKYNNLELVIRSSVPPYIKDKYRSFRNIKIIDGIIPWNQLEKEFKSADIFLFPGHTTPGMTILDAMSYELPVIATDVWGNSEQVEDGKTGFLIKKSTKVPYYNKMVKGVVYYTPAFLRAIKETDLEVAEELSRKIGILIENERLRREMGRNARREVETGKFSIKVRNEKLKRIFDEALG